MMRKWMRHAPTKFSSLDGTLYSPSFNGTYCISSRWVLHDFQTSDTPHYHTSHHWWTPVDFHNYVGPLQLTNLAVPTLVQPLAWPHLISIIVESSWWFYHYVSRIYNFHYWWPTVSTSRGGSLLFRKLGGWVPPFLLHWNLEGCYILLAIHQVPNGMKETCSKEKMCALSK